jgi:hypothetical protein
VIHPDITDWHFDGYTFDSENQSGVAGWNDFCAAADSARESLREAAGISIPKAGFVLQVLMMYLVVLVPANWAIFKVLGRVEWAWIAAPIIAIGGAIAVVKLAQLDIGFARSQSEIAILEMHHGHPRGHATRYTALYSSLSTAYDLRFEDPTALAQPFPTKPRDVSPGVFNREAPTTCYLQRDDGVSLTGFMVRSNTTDFVHSEQMVGLGGALKLLGDEQKGYSIENFTDFTIKDAAVIRRVATGEAFVAYVGELRPKDNRTLAWVAVGEGLKPEEWSKSAVMSKQAAAGATEVSLHRLVDLATSRLRLDAGDIRLVGWMDEALPGLTITPVASQTTTRTLVLAHLKEAPLPPLKPDVNMKLTVIDPEEEEMMPGEDIDNIMPPPIDPNNPFGN